MIVLKKNWKHHREFLLELFILIPALISWKYGLSNYQFDISILRGTSAGFGLTNMALDNFLSIRISKSLSTLQRWSCPARLHGSLELNYGGINLLHISSWIY